METSVFISVKKREKVSVFKLHTVNLELKVQVPSFSLGKSLDYFLLVVLCLVSMKVVPRNKLVTIVTGGSSSRFFNVDLDRTVLTCHLRTKKKIINCNYLPIE
jgi:hypothetical protein